MGGTGGMGAFGGSAGTGGSGTGAAGGTGPMCVPAYCPSLGPGTTPCCTVAGECGYDMGSGCVTQGAGGASGAGGSGVGGSGVGGSGVGGAGGSVTPVHHACNDAPPPGAVLAAPPKPFSGGACPALVNGMNTFGARQFILAVPDQIDPNERLPVVFLWHWLGGSASSFHSKASVQTAVNQQRFIAAIPEHSGKFLFRWPATALDPPGSEAEDLRLFDDILSCVSQQYNVNKECVSSAGVSAGGIWTPQVAIHRSEYLASIITLSGGSGAGFVKPWVPVQHKMPALVLWGGANDNCAGLASFDAASRDLENGLASQGHFLVECVHQCGHGEPPFEPPPGLSKYAGLWQFVFDHPFWLPPGASPYLQNGLGNGIPPWCGIGVGSAKPFTGVCTEPSQC